MKIAKDSVVSLAYQVRTKDGVLVDETTVVAPLEYLHGAGNLIKGLEDALEGRQKGDKFDVEIEADNAYGEYNDNLVQTVPRDVFVGVDELEVGMRFLADTDHGPVPVEITAIDGDNVTIDGNHMLAGQDLKFNVEVVDIREATEEELAHGHVHGAHGHHHHDHGSCGCGGHDHEEDDQDDGCCGGHGCGCKH
ncbi:peptidylprolyl isomerase [Frischella sp. Ac48]|uniref:Peptidyl-prolyl cis-trans isomerase n=1 Tax=Frischella japonica TaxID=2741544 RepID=A0ABR7QUL3_9GAMM|nr:MULTISPECIES: peptidylprolyl isomerase [Frischella]MBC9129810.1 peptidylprolyl isomerase [Frischella japonica]MBX4132800.1 peptidylprolyl isomerase [Frischella sp. Ac48]